MILLFSPNEYFGVKNATMVAVVVMVFGIALFRERLFSPLGTDREDWVPLTPSLVLFRVLYYNVALIGTGHVAGFIGTAIGSPVGSIVVAIGIGAGAIVTSPWATDRFGEWPAEWDPQI